MTAWNWCWIILAVVGVIDFVAIIVAMVLGTIRNRRKRQQEQQRLESRTRERREIESKFHISKKYRNIRDYV